MGQEKLCEKDFNSVIVFSFSEPGAMGPHNMTFYTRNGNSFAVNYMSEDTPYSKIKELFPTLTECYFDGPTKRERIMSRTIVIGGSPDDKETCVADGWKHIYLDFGNHLIVRKEFYYEIKELFSNTENHELTFAWDKILSKTDFCDRVDEIEKAYLEQEKTDAILAAKLDELQKNPEYVKKVKEASGDLDKMMDVLEEFSGIRMTWFELKQFGFRRSDLI